jgi:probable rRNA maturation factor
MRTRKPQINFIVQGKKWFALPQNWEEEISHAIEKTAEYLDRDFSEMEVSVVLTNDKTIQELNKTYRGKDRPTNVLSFPSSVIGELGDIILGAETILREATDAHISLLHHTIHMIVHGFLHLLGYDHEIDEQALEMESMEIRILKDLHIDNPYEER